MLKVRSVSPVIFAGSYLLVLIPWSVQAQSIVVPGTGKFVDEVGDHFEGEDWKYTPNLPKGSSNLNRVDNYPAGGSDNGRWSESTYRGQPDVIQRIPNPPGGLPDSKGALLLRTRQSGILGQLSHEMQQDDLLVNISSKIGYIPVGDNPNFVVRVYLPPWEQWESRTGPSFGVRADCMGREISPMSVGFRRRVNPESEQYWPGMFICHTRPEDSPDKKHGAFIIIRSGNRGEDLYGPTIKELGWWTLGMSVTGDGKVHYFASPGVDKLTMADHIGSYFPHGLRAERFQTFFFNVCNMDDGKTWSTPWVIDDPVFYKAR